MKGSHVWLIASTFAAVVIASMLSIFHFSESKSAASLASENLYRMQQLKGQIIELRSKQINAHFVGEQPVENSSSWVEYGKAAGISESRLVEINRLPINQIAKTSYSRDDVFIRFVDISGAETVRFLAKCSEASIGYSPVSVHMAARPSIEGEAEKWNVSLVLTRLLYTAKTSN